MPWIGSRRGACSEIVPYERTPAEGFVDFTPNREEILGVTRMRAKEAEAARGILAGTGTNERSERG